MFGYFLPAFFARAFAADFWLAVNVFDFFLGFFFSQIGFDAITHPQPYQTAYGAECSSSRPSSAPS